MSNSQPDLDRLRTFITFIERGRKTQMAVDAEIARVLESKNQIQRQLATDDADDVRADIDRLKDRYRSLSLAVLKRLRASSTRHPTRSDIALDELIAEREPEVLREERTKLVTQIANKPEAPTDEDLAFWDVMDEEYESNIRQFESPKATPDQGRPVGPDDAFWINQYLSAPLDPKQPYFDPIPSDQLTGRFASALAKTKLPVADISELSKRFHLLPTINKQQAVRLTEDHVNGNYSPEQRERMMQAQIIAEIVAYAVPNPAEATALQAEFFKAPREAREAVVRRYHQDGVAQTAKEVIPALSLMRRAGQVGGGLKQGVQQAVMPKPPIYAPNLPKGPDLQGLMQEALKKDQKRARFSKL